MCVCFIVFVALLSNTLDTEGGHLPQHRQHGDMVQELLKQHIVRLQIRPVHRHIHRHPPPMRKYPPRLKKQALPPSHNPNNHLQFLESNTSPGPLHHRLCEIGLTAPLAEVSEYEEAERKEGVDDFLEEFDLCPSCCRSICWQGCCYCSGCCCGC